MSKKGDGFWLETTEWDCPNHTYELIGGKCVGYIRAGSDEYMKFKKPLSFSGSRRKFIRVNPELKNLLKSTT